MAPSGSSPNFADCLNVGEAAKFLGVSTATLRNWDRTGKLRPRRHPQNGYRIYLHEDLEALLRSADLSATGSARSASSIDWSDIRDGEHFVQFYEHDDYLVQSVSGYVAAALNAGESSVVIATPDHRVNLQRNLVSHGVDVATHIEAGRYVVLDAADTMAKFMVGGAPDATRFMETVGSLIAQVAENGRRVRAFGEMVALLWADGDRKAAVQLEELWNELGKRHRFSLFCAYPIAGFNHAIDGVPFDGVCNCHSRVIPAESYLEIDDSQERMRAISVLQQKAISLEAEIGHREEVEKVLSKRDRELTDFFDNAIEGIHKVGPDGTILCANRAECELLGYAPSEYVGHSIKEFHADADVIADILFKLQHGETLHNYPARLRCKDGEIKHVLISSNACFEDGQFAYTRCFTRDVTQQWQAEQALRDSIRRKDDFLATLSHELRNPLAPIRNAVEMMRQGQSRENLAVFDDARDVIERQVDQMSRLVEDLLDVSRISRDKLELRKEHVELASVIQSAIEISRPVIDAGGHEFTLTLPSKPAFVEADATRLAQVFANLLNNAAKYTEHGGQIAVQVRTDKRSVEVSVRDNGIGIPCDELAHVFDMFRQVDGSLERAQGGLGIGLTLVRRLVELHGGSVNARSEGLGMGSEFVVQLPRASAQTRAATESSSSQSSVPKKRILVVDDNADAGHTLSVLLRLDGHEVRMAHNGLEAVELAETFSPEVILMDVGMPKLNGYEATRRIRELPGGNEIFIVALTGWGQNSDKELSANAGCSAHLVKPVEYSDLQRLLASRSSN